MEHKQKRAKKGTLKKRSAPRTGEITQKKGSPEDLWSFTNISLLILVAILILFAQVEIGMANGKLGGSLVTGQARNALAANADLSGITSTAQTVATLFPVGEIQTTQDAVNMLIQTGTPEYSAAFGGISFDDPVGSLNTLSRMYPGLKQKVQTEQPETFQRFLALARQPVGISCEYCCGVGPVGIDSKGNSACGCQHNPALLSITLGLMASTDYSDAEVLTEVMRWKALFFPKNMVELAMKAAGGDVPAGNLPGMVGGC